MSKSIKSICLGVAILFSNQCNAETFNIYIINSTLDTIKAEFTGGGNFEIEPFSKKVLNYSGETYAIAVGCESDAVKSRCTFPESLRYNFKYMYIYHSNCTKKDSPYRRSVTITCL
jgi:hypothetical protein